MSWDISVCKVTRYVVDGRGLILDCCYLLHHIKISSYILTVNSSVDTVVTSAADQAFGVKVASLIHLISICKA
jgi:hypothetical protein